MAQARVQIDFIVNDAAFRSALAKMQQAARQAASAISHDLSSLAVGIDGKLRQSVNGVAAAAQESARRTARASQDAATTARQATEAIAAQEKRLADVKARYSTEAYLKGKDSAKNRAKAEEDAANAILHDIKQLQDKRAAIQTAITETESAEVKKRLQHQNKATLDELKLLKQAALDKDAISKGGAGGKVGLLGTGRQAIGNAMGGDLGSLVGGVGGKAALASAGIGVALVAAKESLTIFADYEESLADLSAITEIQGEALKLLGDDARDLGKKFGIDAKDGVESMKLVIGALGPDVAKNREVLRGMTDTVLTFAKAGGIEGQEAADALTVTMSQFGYATADAATQMQVMERIANVQAAASRNGAAEIKDLSASMKIVGATAKNSGLSIEQTAAWLEMLAPAGIKGAEAGTAMRNMLLKLSSGTKQGSDALKAMGLTYDMINPKKVGMVKSMEALKKGYEKLKNPVDKAAATQKLFGMENANAALVMMESAGQVEKFTESITNNAAAEQMAATKMATMKEGFNRFMVQVKDVALTLMSALQPALELIMEGFGYLSQGLGYVAQGLKVVLGWIVDGVKWLINFYVGVGKIVIAIAKWVSQTEIFQASLRVARQVIDWVSGAIGTLVGWVGSAWKWVKNLASGFVDWLRSISPVRAAIDAVADAIGWVIEKAKEAWGWIQKTAGWTGLVDEEGGPTPPPAAAPTKRPESDTADVAALAQQEPGGDEHLIKSGRGGGGGGAGAGEKKSAYDAAIEKAEEAHNEVLHKLSLDRRNNVITEAQLNVKQAAEEVRITQEKIEAAKKYNKSTVQLERDLQLQQLDLRDAHYEEEKSLLEEKLTEDLEIIERNFLEGKINDEQAKAERVRKEQAHNARLIELAKEYNHDYLTEQRKALKLSIEVGKANLEEDAGALRDHRDDQLLQLEQDLEAGTVKEEEYAQKKQAIQQEYITKATEAVQKYGAESKEVIKEIAASERDLTNIKKEELKKQEANAKAAAEQQKKDLEDFKKNNVGYRMTYELLTKSVNTSLSWLDERWKTSFTNQKTVLFQALSIMSETTKGFLSDIGKEYADKIAIIVGENLAAAGSYMISAVASLISWQMSLGWWNLLLIPGEIAALYGMYEGARKLFGFSGGGYTGDGRVDDPAGIVHRGEVVVPAWLVQKPGVKDFLLSMISQGGPPTGYKKGGEVGGMMTTGKPFSAILPPEIATSIHIGKFATDSYPSLPPTAITARPEIATSIHIGKFATDSYPSPAPLPPMVITARPAIPTMEQATRGVAPSSAYTASGSSVADVIDRMRTEMTNAIASTKYVTAIDSYRNEISLSQSNYENAHRAL